MENKVMSLDEFSKKYVDGINYDTNNGTDNSILIRILNDLNAMDEDTRFTALNLVIDKLIIYATQYNLNCAIKIVEKSRPFSPDKNKQNIDKIIGAIALYSDKNDTLKIEYDLIAKLIPKSFTVDDFNKFKDAFDNKFHLAQTLIDYGVDKDQIATLVIDDYFEMYDPYVAMEHLKRFQGDFLSLNLSEENKLRLMQRAKNAIVYNAIHFDSANDEAYYAELTKTMNFFSISSDVRSILLNDTIAVQVGDGKLSDHLANKTFANFLTNEFRMVVGSNNDKPVSVNNIAAGFVAGKLAFVFSEQVNVTPNATENKPWYKRLFNMLTASNANVAENSNQTLVHYDGQTFGVDGMIAKIEIGVKAKPVQEGRKAQFAEILALVK